MMISSCNVGPFENQASSVTMETKKLVEGEECREFEIEQKLSRRVHLFYLDYLNTEVGADIYWNFYIYELGFLTSRLACLL